MAVIAVQDQSLSNWLKMEAYADLAYARNTYNFTGVAGTKYPHGTVVADDNGNVIPWTGAQDPVGMLYHTETGTGAAQKVLVLFRGPAAVRLKGLVFPNTVTAPQIENLRKKLEFKGFEVLDSVIAEPYAN